MNSRKFMVLSGATVALAGCTEDEETDDGAPDEGAFGDENEGDGESMEDQDAEERTEDAEGADDPDEGEGSEGEDEDDEEDEDAEEGEDGEDGGDGGDDESGAPYEFDGEGSEETDPFALRSGFTAVEFEHGGSGRFAVDLGSAGTNELLINADGPVEGSTGVGVDDGEYTLSIEADGAWSLVVSQPSASDPTALPASFDGETATHLGPFAFDGERSLAGSHEGSGRFLVEVLDEAGDLVERAIDDVGEIETTATVEHDGVCWIVLEADGEWSLSLE
ncbi:MAG: hypothetical protein QXG03_06810 [Halalkalicoccus sp.]